ncbi:MAG: hypothetical protein ABIT37_24855 [Luteolibacter sp.]
MLEIEGRIEMGDQTVGMVDAHYLFADEPASDAAFFELWDSEARSCAVYEEIIDHDRQEFREPIPRFLDPASGLLCVHFIALRPPFRRMNLGREVMRELVRAMADPRIGLVLLDATPLQHLPHGYDDFDDEVRDLPWNSPDEDKEALMRHFSGWGMQRLPGTCYMMATPDILRDVRVPQWPPCPILDQWNTCAACGGWIDKEAEEWIETDYGMFHKDCE